MLESLSTGSLQQLQWRAEPLPLPSHSAYLSPLLRATPMSFSMPPASLRALVFSMFLVMTSCSAQQIAVMVSSDMVFPTRLLALVPPPPAPLLLLLLLPPGKRCTRSLMAYLPAREEKSDEKSFGFPRNDAKSCKRGENTTLCNIDVN